MKDRTYASFPWGFSVSARLNTIRKSFNAPPWVVTFFTWGRTNICIRYHIIYMISHGLISYYIINSNSTTKNLHFSQWRQDFLCMFTLTKSMFWSSVHTLCTELYLCLRFFTSLITFVRLFFTSFFPFLFMSLNISS